MGASGHLIQASSQPLLVLTPERAIIFYNAHGEEIGRLDFSSDTMTFTGNADAAAMVFIQAVALLPMCGAS